MFGDSLENLGSPQEDPGREQDKAIEQRFDDFVMRPKIRGLLHQLNEEESPDFKWKFPNFADRVIERIKEAEKNKEQ